MNTIHYIIVTVAFLLAGAANAAAQTDRNLIRQGNRAFKTQKWAVAETQYRKAISKNQKNPQAIYNLGCALMTQQKDSWRYCSLAMPPSWKPTASAVPRAITTWA